MAGIIRWVLAMAITIVGLNLAARLQVYEDASFAVRGNPGQIHKGQVSRDILSGDWIVKKADGQTEVIPDASFGALAYQPGDLSWKALIVGVLTFFLVAAFLIGPSTIVRAIQHLRKPSP